MFSYTNSPGGQRLHLRVPQGSQHFCPGFAGKGCCYRALRGHRPPWKELSWPGLWSATWCGLGPFAWFKVQARFWPWYFGLPKTLNNAGSSLLPKLGVGSGCLHYVYGAAPRGSFIDQLNFLGLHQGLGNFAVCPHSLSIVALQVLLVSFGKIWNLGLTPLRSLYLSGWHFLIPFL